ncbi:MAG: hypothetical protein JWL76_1154 [Thermoleophilia bacterium]|nr:hypothetical protein [Thermoleophilia bacterium]
MTISLNQMRTVVAAGDAVPEILTKALPALDDAGVKLAQFGDFVQPQALEKVVEQADGTYAYVTSRSQELMDMPWSDAVAARHEVSSAIGGVQDTLNGVKAGSITSGQTAGPPSEAVKNATEALAELDLAQTQLSQSLHVWVGEFGGAHAQLVPKHVDATAEHLGRAQRLMEGALRRHVND